MLLEESQGEYVAFVDDDDLVSNDYVGFILRAIDREPDVVGLHGIITTNGKNAKPFIHSIKYKTWFENNGIYYRYPNHLNPVKRVLALQVKFPDKSHGEDRDYSDRLFPLLKTEVMIEDPIYFYLYVDK